MLKIRLQRSGRKNRPNYRIVVAEHSAPIQGRYIDLVGTFDPLIEKHGFKADAAKIEEWIKKGAKPTNTVARLLKGSGVSGMEAYIVEMKDKAVKNAKDAPKDDTAAEGTPESDTAADEVSEAGDDSSTDEPKEEAAPAEEENKEEEAPAEEPKEDAGDDGATAGDDDDANDDSTDEAEETPVVEDKKKEDTPEDDTPVEEASEGEEKKDEEPA